MKTKEVDFMGIGKLSFVAGISVTHIRPFETIAENLRAIAENMDSIADAIQTIANGIDDIQKELPKTRQALLAGTVDMELAGKELVEVGTTMENAGIAIRSI